VAKWNLGKVIETMLVSGHTSEKLKGDPEFSSEFLAVLCLLTKLPGL